MLLKDAARVTVWLQDKVISMKLSIIRNTTL